MIVRRIGLALVLASVVGRASGQANVSEPILFRGMCDASAAVAVASNLFVAADDEGNHLRLFHAETSGPPLQFFDLSGFLRLDAEHPEADFEGAAWLGDRVYWISSHGRNREGKHRPNRHCFFATEVRMDGGRVQLQPVGVCYKNLLTDLLFDPRLRPFQLAAASALPPKAQGGLNIEGLCATADQRLLIGFRNPIPGGRALIVPLLNPTDVVRGLGARFGDPVLLDLGGLGIRDLGFWQGTIYVLAGPYDSEKKFRLYQWTGGPEPPRPLSKLDFGKLRPEALVFYADNPRFQVLSDDGTRDIGGTNCKELKDPMQKRFRGAWVSP